MHSPTLFQWGRALQSNPRHWPSGVRQRQDRLDFTAIEAWRRELECSQTVLQRLDLGAGSRSSGKRNHGPVFCKDVARTALTPQKDIASLCRALLAMGPAGRFLELGTSLGVTSACVAKVGWEVETWEGCPETLAMAREGWSNLGLSSNITSKQGDFRNLIEHLLPGQMWDVVYLDGLHSERETVLLADRLSDHVKHCLVVDDIAWSVGMHRAWRELQSRGSWNVRVVWRGKGLLFKAPHMASQFVRFR